MCFLEVPKEGAELLQSFPGSITQLLEVLVILCCLLISDIHCLAFLWNGEVLHRFACTIQNTKILLKIP